MKPANCCAGWCAISLRQIDSARAAGARRLAQLGFASADLCGNGDHPAIAWRRAGLWELGGLSDGPALMLPLPLAVAADGAVMALRHLAKGPADLLPQRGSLLLGERARLTRAQRQGPMTPTQHCRLIDTADGRVAINLARDDDWSLVPAWLQRSAEGWEDIRTALAHARASEIVERGAMLGLPVALDSIPEPRPWFAEQTFAAAPRLPESPLVVDLSSLWAGPLAANLLHLSGMRVVKVESAARPDGARRGNAQFYDLLNAGKQSVSLDFTSKAGRADLAKLIAAADIVIEASRPRALRQLGIDAQHMLHDKPGKIWLRLLAYGDDETRIGFGDDIGVSAGLSRVLEAAWGETCFVGDAIADPVSGIYAALAAAAKWRQGGGALIEISMRDVVRDAMGDIPAHAELTKRAREWQAMAEADEVPLYPMRSASIKAAGQGADTQAVMQEISDF